MCSDRIVFLIRNKRLNRPPAAGLARKLRQFGVNTIARRKKPLLIYLVVDNIQAMDDAMQQTARRNKAPSTQHQGSYQYRKRSFF
jgi:hypothetical protein